MALLNPTQPVATQPAAVQPVAQPADQDPMMTRALSPEEIAAANAQFMGQPDPQPVQQPVYQQPVQQPVYQQPVYEQPAPQPVYQQPVQQPVYQQAPAQWQDQQQFQQAANHFQPPAVAVQNTQMAVRQAAPDLAEAGFGGLALGIRSFPIISLKTDGLFEDTDGKGYGKEFFCRLINSRAKTAVQGTKVVAGKPDEKVFFTYDGISTTSGRSVAEAEAEFIADGRSLSRREYTDALVIMEAPGTEYDGELRIMSISPTSRERLAGKVQALAIRSGWTTADLAANVGNFRMVVRVGEKVIKAVQPFYPWEFMFQQS